MWHGQVCFLTSHCNPGRIIPDLYGCRASLSHLPVLFPCLSEELLPPDCAFLWSPWHREFFLSSTAPLLWRHWDGDLWPALFSLLLPVFATCGHFHFLPILEEFPSLFLLKKSLDGSFCLNIPLPIPSLGAAVLSGLPSNAFKRLLISCLTFCSPILWKDGGFLQRKLSQGSHLG